MDMQVRARLADQVESGQYYEAQQTYKATYNRYKGKKDLANAFSILEVRQARTCADTASSGSAVLRACRLLPYADLCH